MATSEQLENYLAALERALKPLPVSERADIITEIKSHVFAALEREPGAAVESVLKALGEPEIVANRYLLESGLQTAKPPISPVVKWVVLGFLGTFFISFLFVGLVLWKFRPLLVVDEEKDHVVILGGLIDINGKEGRVRVGAAPFLGGTVTAGEKDLKALGVKRVFVRFNSGALEVGLADDAKLSWECKSRPAGQVPEPTVEGENLTFQFTDQSRIKCELHLPRGVAIDIEGTNAKLELEEPAFDVKATLQNGKVEIKPDEAVRYGYELQVKNGKVETFVSDKNPQHRIAIQIVNGKIDRN